MRTTLFFLSIIILISCSTSSPEGSIPGNYQTVHTATVQSPVMYVKDMVIADTSVINDYLRRHNVMSYFIYTSTEFIADTLLQMNIVNDNNITYKINYLPYIFAGKKIPLSSNQVKIEVHDSTTGPMSPVTPNRCDTLTTISNKYPIFFSLKTINGITYRTLKPFIVLSEVGGQFSLPVVVTSYGSVKHYGSCTLTGFTGRIFITDHVETMLLPGDTIILQKKTVPLERVP